MIYGERTHRSAFCIGTNGSVAPLTRTPFMSGNFNEAWLQELLEDNPAMIPAAGVSPEYQDLVCIGREVPVGSGETQGYIDNLYVTPSGGIVIVETKLYRNQRRVALSSLRSLTTPKSFRSGTPPSWTRLRTTTPTARTVRHTGSST